MYIPQKYRVNDEAVVKEFIRKNNFGLLISTDGTTIDETLTPFIISNTEDCLLGHIARANSQWETWDDSTIAKAIFTGSHAYISPTFYESEFNVPTWNYTAVSVSGKIQVINEASEIIEFIDALVARHEHPEFPWKLDKDDERYLNLLSGTVVFRLEIEKMEASFKLNQNKKAADQVSVINALDSSSNPMDRDIAEMMTKNLK